MLRKGSTSFIAGFATAAMLFGGAAMANSIYQQQITVTYTPLKYAFDGSEKLPPADQKGFIYNDRTYVPLRFMSEALGKEVKYDPETTTIYVGRRPSALPALWAHFTPPQSGAAIKLQYFEEGVRDIDGVEMDRAVLISSMVVAGQEVGDPNLSIETLAQQDLPAGTTMISGTLFVPDLYFGKGTDRKIGRLTITNENNQVLYRSEDMTSGSRNLPFKAETHLSKEVRIFVTMYYNQGIPTSDSLLTTWLGISDLQVK